MAQGDIFCNGVTEVAAGDFIDMKPPLTNEAVVHNIAIGPGSWELQIYDDTSNKSIVLDKDTAPSFLTQQFLHCKPTSFYRVKCITGPILVHYDGVITK